MFNLRTVNDHQIGSLSFRREKKSVFHTLFFFYQKKKKWTWVNASIARYIIHI